MSFASRISQLLLLVAFLVAGHAQAAEKSQPRLSGYHARVAQGGKVELAAPKLTASELAVLRPDYEKLKPRARSNAE